MLEEPLEDSKERVLAPDLLAMNSTEKYFSCECNNPEHAMLVSYYDDDIEFTEKRILDGKNVDCWPMPELTFNVQMNPYLGFWKRLWVGIKYILGIQSKYMHWNVCVIREEQIDNLIELCTMHKDGLAHAKRVREMMNVKKRQVY